MATVHLNGHFGQSVLSARDRVLNERPYHPWHLIPLAVFLCESGWEYTDEARRRIVEAAEEGRPLRHMVRDGWLEPTDLRAAQKRLREGRRWLADYRASQAAASAEIHRWAAEETARMEAIAATYPTLEERTGVSLMPPELEMLDELLGPDPGPTEAEAEADPMDFPRTKTAADYREGWADVAAFYTEHPEE